MVSVFEIWYWMRWRWGNSITPGGYPRSFRSFIESTGPASLRRSISSNGFALRNSRKSLSEGRCSGSWRSSDKWESWAKLIFGKGRAQVEICVIPVKPNAGNVTLLDQGSGMSKARSDGMGPVTSSNNLLSAGSRCARKVYRILNDSMRCKLAAKVLRNLALKFLFSLSQSASEDPKGTYSRSISQERRTYFPELWRNHSESPSWSITVPGMRIFFHRKGTASATRFHSWQTRRIFSQLLASESNLAGGKTFAFECVWTSWKINVSISRGRRFILGVALCIRLALTTASISF